MRLQSAIFDMDGTLLDSMPTWRELGPTFLKEAGITATPEQDRMLHTLADCDVIPYLREVCGLPWSQQEIIDQIKKICRRDPRTGKVVTGGIVSCRDSSWLLSWTINRCLLYTSDAADE